MRGREVQMCRADSKESGDLWRRQWHHNITFSNRNCLGWVQAGGGELGEAVAWLQAHGADSDGSDAEVGGGGALSALAAQVASLPPGARSSQQARSGVGAVFSFISGSVRMAKCRGAVR